MSLSKKHVTVPVHRLVFIVGLASLALAGCTASDHVRQRDTEPRETSIAGSDGSIDAAADTGTDDSEALASNSPILERARLLSEVERWKGTRYRYGGSGARGFDCSGFVYRVYSDALGVTLPRTTRAQMKVGRAVPEEQLRFADLVFFYTPARTDHVGIYLGEGEFAHASSSGVMISHLDEDYWKRSYRTARRPVAVDSSDFGSLATNRSKTLPPSPPFTGGSSADDLSDGPRRVGW